MRSGAIPARMAGTSGARPFRGGSTQITWGRMPPGQLGGGLSRVTAEEADVVHAVPGGVGPGVLNGLGDDLRADDLGGRWASAREIVPMPQ